MGALVRSRGAMTKLAALLAAVLLEGVLLGGASAATGVDWPSFGDSVGAASTGITAANVGKLQRQMVQIDGTLDSSPIYLHAVTIKGATHDAFFFTTTYGKTEALDATNGKLLWRYTPPTYASYAGSAQITALTPVADPARTAIYAGESDGHIVKLSVATGKLLWSTSITRDPTHEKLAGSLSYSRGLVITATDGYDGDAPPYQGHVVTLNPASGQIEAVWNSLCSTRHTIMQPSTCSESDSGIWGRSAPVIDPANGDILIATGNAPFDGKNDWGDSVLVLSPDAKTLLKHWTPVDQGQLNAQDLDLGSTAPALINASYFVQGGKDGKLRLLSLARLAGANPATGGELQTVPTPGNSALRSEPVAWLGKWVFLADDEGTAAWRFVDGRLHAAWSNNFPGTSPVVAGGLVYVQGSTGIHVYVPATGREVADLPIGTTHWQSPIVADGRVAAGEGDSNDHATTGVFDIYRLG
jgi:outer membrane protein assembly factor BamB